MSRLGLKRNIPAPSNGAARYDAPAQAPAHKFTDRQASFIDHYVFSKNATQSAIKAGYSENDAHVQGSRLLSKAKVRDEVERRLAARAKRLDIDGDWVIRELAKVARGNMSRYMRANEDGSPRLDFSNLSEDDTAALQSVTVEEFKDGRSDKREVRRVKFALWDKVKALDTLGKHFGIYAPEQVDHRHQHTLMGTLLLEIDAESRGKTIDHD